MIQEIEQFRKTGKRKKRAVNTKNILFIMSGAFNDLTQIINKRMKDQGIGFGAHITSPKQDIDLLKHVKSEDLIKYGFESEFVGRLPVRSVFEHLTEDDLFEILKNPNNPIIISKKLDFTAYGIDIRFEDKALRLLAKNAFSDNTGARGLVSAIESKMLLFEKKLPSKGTKKFPVTAAVIENPEESLEALITSPDENKINESFEKLSNKEKESIKDYLKTNSTNLSEKYSLTMTPSRIDVIAEYYTTHILDTGSTIKRIKSFYDGIKKIELYFFKTHDINIVLEEDAIDYIIEQFVASEIHLDDFYKQLTKDFELGLKLVREKTGKNRFFITRKALLNPESFISELIKDELR